MCEKIGVNRLEAELTTYIEQSNVGDSIFPFSVILVKLQKVKKGNESNLLELLLKRFPSDSQSRFREYIIHTVSYIHRIPK